MALTANSKTKAQWATDNTVLASGELGYESDTPLFKIGDGTTAWNPLGYYTADADLPLTNTTFRCEGLRVAEAANGKQGVATLVAGTKTVANTSVTANSRIFLSVQSLGTVVVATPVAVTARTPGVSFVITSAGGTDTSVIAYEIFEPA